MKIVNVILNMIKGLLRHFHLKVVIPIVVLNVHYVEMIANFLICKTN
jgi:hypothetical protein